MAPEYDAELRNAYFLFNELRSPNLTGQIYGDKKGRFSDGERVYTSTLQEHLPGGVFVTRNTRYLVRFADEFMPQAAAEESPPMTFLTRQSIPTTFIYCAILGTILCVGLLENPFL